MGLVDLYAGGGPTAGGPHPSLAVLNRQGARFQDPRFVCAGVSEQMNKPVDVRRVI
jgi:hypothetical protein